MPHAAPASPPAYSREGHSIDIVAVTREGRVVKCRTHVPPRRIVLSLRAFAIVELAAGAVARVGLREGDQLAIAPAVTGRLQD
jgi:uncharacterized membrane protein (UPF0127 family)